MEPYFPIPDEFRYRPGGWAKASVLLGALGWFANIGFAIRAGVDVAQGACFNGVAGLLLLPVPLALGRLCWSWCGRSQRAGDIAFALAMAAQGVLLFLAGYFAPPLR